MSGGVRASPEDYGYGAHTYRFHTDPTQQLTAYTVFHDDHSQKNASTYRDATLKGTAWGPGLASGALSTQRQDLTIGGTKTYGAGGPVEGSAAAHKLASTLRSNTTATAGASEGKPYPTWYKAYLTENRDEYRDPVVQQQSLTELTTRYNTIKPPAKKNPQPLYETRVVAF